ncbi:hypothetical protein T01_649 [Trichinella spiralis]|uniref:Uncharacterized protein n=1 Tax=Trichinella spiralis TaxID=6334 RepID=A0A0V1BLY9_TRISP|nr:hypothetical protein T01_649 [Trichinella spiralis]
MTYINGTHCKKIKSIWLRIATNLAGETVSDDLQVHITENNSMLFRSREEEHNENYYCIKSGKRFCLLNVLKSCHSRTCLPENVCKFLFHCYTYVSVALVAMVVGLRYRRIEDENGRPRGRGYLLIRWLSAFERFHVPCLVELSLGFICGKRNG